MRERASDHLSEKDASHWKEDRHTHDQYEAYPYARERIEMKKQYPKDIRTGALRWKRKNDKPISR